ncbi:MAG: hypothetical protein H0X08_10375, partial [Blastocatellia bacterium]|nr:hypothetical protein [Blastocatellia bacterium]
MIALAVGATTAFAQGRYANVYNRGQVDGFVRQLEASSDAFHNDFRRQVDNSNLGGSTKRQLKNYAEQFENAVDRLRSRFDSGDSWWESRNEVQAMISNSQNLNSTMNTVSFRRNLERQWNRLRNDVNKLADTYDLPGLNGGGWSGGGGGGGGGYPGGGGNVPSWAAGTFYGRDRQTGSAIALTIARNGSVSVSVDGNSPSYASLNGTTLTNGPYVSRVTRRGNGIRTTDINNRNNFIDYSRTPNNGGGGNPGGGGHGNIASWAVGTFYGNDSLSGSNLAMTISQNGQVSISIDGGAPIFASLNGTTLT